MLSVLTENILVFLAWHLIYLVIKMAGVSPPSLLPSAIFPLSSLKQFVGKGSCLEKTD